MVSTRTIAGPRTACTRSRFRLTVIAGTGWGRQTMHWIERAFSRGPAWPTSCWPSLIRGTDRGAVREPARSPRSHVAAGSILAFSASHTARCVACHGVGSDLGAALPGRLSHARSERVERSFGLSHPHICPVTHLVARLHQVSRSLARCLRPMSH